MKSTAQSLLVVHCTWCSGRAAIATAAACRCCRRHPLGGFCFQQLLPQFGGAGAISSSSARRYVLRRVPLSPAVQILQSLECGQLDGTCIE